MTGPPRASADEWTYSEYARLPDDGSRYEILDGEVLLTPAPTPHHQNVVARLLVELLEYVEGRKAGWVFQDVDLLFATGHFLRPDIVVVPADRREGITDRGVEVAPALVIEVLSPPSRTLDLVRKPRRYLDLGVPAYWVVDALDGAVWIWDPVRGPDTPVRERTTVRWALPSDATALELEVAPLIAPL
jgi:Uma2 family endonuclease